MWAHIFHCEGQKVIYNKKKYSAGILFNKEKQQATGELLKSKQFLVTEFIAEFQQKRS